MNTPHAPKSIRVTVPVTPEVLETFQRLAKAGQMSTGRAMGEWLGDTIDAAEFMASKMEQARATPKLVARELHSYALGLTDMTSELIDSMKKPKGSASGGAQSATRGETFGDFADSLKRPAKTPLTPPSSNTGGKVPQNTKKTPKGSK